MSKRDKRREQSNIWEDVPASMSLEEAAGLGYGLTIQEDSDDDNLIEQTPANAIIPASEGTFVYKRFTLTPTGLQLPDDTSQEEWTELGHMLHRLHGSLQWVIGDWLAFQRNRSHGETYQEIAEIFGFEVQTLRDYAYVARNVDSSIRIDTLSFAHHQLVAGIRDRHDQPDTERQQAWLQRAAQHGWSVRAMREQIKARQLSGEAKTMSQELFAPERKPRVTARMETLWIKARNGDEKARERLLETIQSHRQWLSEVERSIRD